MNTRLQRSIKEPIREGLTTAERWANREDGLVWCWERGRQKRDEDKQLAEAADRGELVTLAWEGGVQKELKMDEKAGTLQYLATWQGLRGEDLDLSLVDDVSLTCSRFNQIVVFTPNWERPTADD